MEYTPSGQVSALTEKAVLPGGSHQARTVTEYDRHGRVTSLTASLDSGAGIPAAVFSYNSIGKLCNTAVPGLEIGRTYNIRGSLRSIQSPVYEETLRYEEGVETPNMTGRISERDFKLYGDRRRSYYYSYDGMGRLTVANSRDEQQYSWGRTSVIMEFDRNSNVTHIIRTGAVAAGVYDLIDNATFAYDGNRLQGMTDLALQVNLETSLDLPSGEFGEESFAYDANGNMTCDLTRGISDMTYSAANRPLRITLGNGRHIDYVYDANGVKVEAIEPIICTVASQERKIADIVNSLPRPVASTISHDYRGGFEFRNGRLLRYNLAGGYFGSDGVYYSNITDFQGNVVAVTSADTTGSFNIHQLNAYYPDGMPIAQEALLQGGYKPVVKLSDDNRYKFGSKELTTLLGADFYDFEARMRPAAMPAFTSIDSKATNYQDLTPYNFCAGDPVNYVDPTGEATFLNKDGIPIGTDGIDDKKVYFLSHLNPIQEDHKIVKNASLSQKSYDKYVNFVTSNSGNHDAFKGHSIYGDAWLLPGTQQNRIDMLNCIKDDGDPNNSTADNNNREYGSYIKNGKVFYATPGDVANPLLGGSASITINAIGVTTLHSHPSGWNSNGAKYADFNQYPSAEDMRLAGKNVCYVVGMANGQVYVYNQKGVYGQMSIKNFGSSWKMEPINISYIFQSILNFFRFR